MVRRTSTSAKAAVSPDDMRQAVQPRAKATIDRVCAAALGILTEGGWDSFNTNAVAARAGVTGPTVYRYFPNKYVLAAELRRRVVAAEDQAVLPAIDCIGNGTALADAVETWVTATLAARADMPAALLLRSVGDSIPDLALPDGVDDVVVGALAAALLRLQPLMGPAEAKDRAHALRTSVDSLVDDAIRAGRHSEGQMSLVVDMALALVAAAARAPVGAEVRGGS